MPCAPRIWPAIPAELRIVAEIPAGAGFGGHVGPGEAARIFTGAPLPAGADTIVIQEDTERARRPGPCPRRRAARPLCPAARGSISPRARYCCEPAGGSRARDIGLAAAMNRPWLFVHRRPRVGDPVDRRRDRDARRPDRAAPDRQLEQPGARRLCRRLRRGRGIGRQRPRRPRRRCAASPPRRSGVDLLVTTGGVSVGEHDLVRDVLAADGLELDFWQIAMRPGKPLMVGRYRGTPMLGLPGNPVSTLVCALLFLKPAIDRLSGLPDAAEAAADGAARRPARGQRPAPGLPALAPRPRRRRHARSVSVRGAGQLDDAAPGVLPTASSSARRSPPPPRPGRWCRSCRSRRGCCRSDF